MEEKKPKKRNHLRNLTVAIFGFSAFALHVMLTKGGFGFIAKMLHGDLIYIGNTVMTLFVLSGWFLVYKYLGKLL